jgi:hypothetical protein
MVKFFNIKLILALSAVIVGSVSTVYGFIQLNLNDLSMNSENETVIFLSTLIGVHALSIFFNVNRYYLFTSLIILSSIVLEVFTPLLTVLYFLTSSYYLGSLISLLIKKDDISIIIKSLIGMIIYGSLVGISVHFSINTPELYLIILSIPIIIYRKELINLVTNISFYPKNNSFDNPTSINLIDSLIISVGFLYFLISLMPEIGHDALATHLFIPAHIQEYLRWDFNVNYYVWAVGPKLGDWIITIPYLLGGETAVRLFNISTIFIICLLLVELTKYFQADNMVSRCTVLLFITSPFTFGLGSTIFNEPIWCLFLISFFYYFTKIIHDNEINIQNFSIAGVMLGASLAAKAITLILLPIIILISLFRINKIFQRENLIAISLFIFLITIFSIKPYLISYLYTENPVFPFFNGIFKSPFYDASSNFQNPIWGYGISWDLFYQITFNSAKYTEASIGGIGFHLLLLSIPAIIILILENQYRPLMFLFFALASIWVTFEFTAYLRYTFPAQVLIILCSSLIIQKSEVINLTILKIIKIIFGITILLNLFFLDSGYGLKEIDYDVIKYKNNEARENYLLKYKPQRIAVEHLNNLNINKKPVAVFSESAMAGLRSHALYQSWYNPQFSADILDTFNEVDMLQVLNVWDVEYVLINREWPFTNRKEYIFSISDKIASYGKNDLLKVNYSLASDMSNESKRKELIKNNTFEENLENWNYSEANLFFGEGIIASVISPVSQAVPIFNNKIYRYSLKSRCADKNGVPGRLQINWLDENGEFIDTNIELFECVNTYKEYSLSLRSPVNAKYAVVIIGSHTEDNLIFKSVSLK